MAAVTSFEAENCCRQIECTCRVCLAHMQQHPLAPPNVY